jgi:hypothetical protein
MNTLSSGSWTSEKKMRLAYRNTPLVAASGARIATRTRTAAAGPTIGIGAEYAFAKYRLHRIQFFRLRQSRPQFRRHYPLRLPHTSLSSARVGRPRTDHKTDQREFDGPAKSRRMIVG